MVERKDIEIINSDIVVNALLLGELLEVAPADVPALMRSQAITSICERGIDEHEGYLRLSFFYLNRRARLRVDMLGHVLQRSVIDFGRPRTQRTRRAPII